MTDPRMTMEPIGKGRGKTAGRLNPPSDKLIKVNITQTDPSSLKNGLYIIPKDNFDWEGDLIEIEIYFEPDGEKPGLGVFSKDLP